MANFAERRGKGKKCFDSCLECGSLHLLKCPPSFGVKDVRNDGWAPQPAFPCEGPTPKFGIFGEDKRDNRRIHAAIPPNRSGFSWNSPGYVRRGHLRRGRGQGRRFTYKWFAIDTFISIPGGRTGGFRPVDQMEILGNLTRRRRDHTTHNLQARLCAAPHLTKIWVIYAGPLQ